MTRRCRSGVRRLAAALVAISLGIAGAASGTGLAVAQERVERKSLFELLFSPRQPQQTEPAARRTRDAKRRTSRPQRARQSAAPAPSPAVEKLPNALKILVIGDFMAGGLADGLETAFEESPGVVVIDRSNGSSGLVRNDYYDWPGEIAAILDEIDPVIVVLLVGSNDRQNIRTGGTSEPVRSQAWNAEYARRAEALASAVQRRGINLLWVGAPPFRSPSMSADMLSFNGIFRVVATKVGAEFIDIWDGFVDEDGKFVFTGSDIKGQQVRLRGSDGINMTRAGQRKLAFYVEKPARRILGPAAEAGVAALGDELSGGLAGILPPGAQQEPSEIDRTVPISLVDPDLDGGLVLLGAPAGRSADDGDRNGADTPRALLVRRGETAAAPPGRADNFAWPPQRDIIRQVAETPAVYGPPPPPERDGADDAAQAAAIPTDDIARR